MLLNLLITMIISLVAVAYKYYTGTCKKKIVKSFRKGLKLVIPITVTSYVLSFIFSMIPFIKLPLLAIQIIFPPLDYVLNLFFTSISFFIVTKFSKKCG